MMVRVLQFALLAATAAVPAQAQSSAEDDVRQVVQKLFDGMRARDTVALRMVFDSGARLVTTSNQGGQPTVRVTPIDDFIQIIVTAAPGQVLDEQLQETEVKVADNLAVVWTKYRFYVGAEFSHCGVDAFQLAKTAGGWKLIALADTHRPPDQC